MTTQNKPTLKEQIELAERIHKQAADREAKTYLTSRGKADCRARARARLAARVAEIIKEYRAENI